MKTLDEVIEILQEWMPDCPVKDDALHYLKTYRENQQAYEEGNRKAEEARERYLEAVKICEITQKKYLQSKANYDEKLSDHISLRDAWAMEQENPPLTWDELQSMEGKPVWVVPEAEKGYWFVIEFFNNNPYYGGDRVCFTNDVMLNRSDLGKTWQAYRKER